MSIPASDTGWLDAGRIDELIAARFPQVHSGGRTMVVEDVGPGRARVRLKADLRNTRPGGTISGIAMFALADFSVYVAIIGRLGEPGLDAVTTNMNINFLAKPEPRDLVAEVRMLRLGRRLAVGEVEMFSDGGIRAGGACGGQLCAPANWPVNHYHMRGILLPLS